MSKIEYTNEDCMVGMARYPDKYFDLAIVDPPYAIDIDVWDSEPPPKEYFDELKRVSKEQIIWGANYFGHVDLTGGRIIWNKLGKFVGKMNMLGMRSECEIAYCSMHKCVRMFSYTFVGAIRGNAYKPIKGVDNRRIHTTQKPIELYLWLLEKYAKPGFKILDTHVGSASSLVAFHRAGFEAVGFELDKEIYQSSNARLGQEQRQKSLFARSDLGFNVD